MLKCDIYMLQVLHIPFHTDYAALMLYGVSALFFQDADVYMF